MKGVGASRQDPFGLDQIFVQAKRYASDHPVDRQAIQAFIGASFMVTGNLVALKHGGVVWSGPKPFREMFMHANEKMDVTLEERQVAPECPSLSDTILKSLRIVEGSAHGV